ncbi:MAG TPA: CHRD domain-containing protein [Actinomycetota bacterium]|jgi:CHRD domain|nr:CHRD domain-containing protein [Actinomycetota bacterium]
MRSRVTAVALSASLLLGLALLAAPAAGASGKVTRLAASLDGANEVPGPGDPDGHGRAFVRLAGGKACFALEWSKLAAPTAAHIHEGRAGARGDVVVPFFQPGTNAASLPTQLASVAGCVDVDRAVARKIAAHPRDFYVNIHTADFPDGAVRGQLHPSRHLDLDLPHQLGARLDGANEVPPADPDGRGLALVRTGRERVCFAVGWTRIGAPIFAHIHAGAAGVNGPVVVLFFDVPELPGLPPGTPPAALPDTVSAAAGCVGDQDPALLRDIRRHPAAYYTNVHNLEFPGGAIRGQLRRLA